MHCDGPPIEDLVAWLDGELPAADAARVAAHVDACAACRREADGLRRSGELVAALPRATPSADFAARVLASSRAGAAPRRGRLLRLVPAAAAAAAVAAVLLWRAVGPQRDAELGVLTASEERDIAADLYLLTNLDALESGSADELIGIVDDLDVLEAAEPEVAGLYAATSGDVR